MRAPSSTTELCPSCVPAPICTDGWMYASIISSNFYGNAVHFQGTLRSFQDAHHAQAVAAIADRRVAGMQAIDKMLAFDLQRLRHVDPGNQDVAEAYLNGFSVSFRRRNLGMAVVDAQLFGGFGVVKHRHLVGPHDGCLADLVRIEPAQMNVCHDAVLKVQADESHILNAVLDIALAAHTHVGGLHVEHEKNLRDIVRGKAPQGVFVAADTSQVYALRVDVVERAKLARLDHCFKTAHDRVVFEKMADHEHAVLFFREFHQLLCVAQAQSKGLLDEHIAAHQQGLFREFVMRDRG